MKWKGNTKRSQKNAVWTEPKVGNDDLKRDRKYEEWGSECIAIKWSRGSLEILEIF